MTSNASIRFGFCLPVRPDETSPRRLAALYELCPEDCVAQIEGFHRITGCEYFLAAFGDSGGIEHTRAALELFGREVVPAFA